MRLSTSIKRSGGSSIIRYQSVMLAQVKLIANMHQCAFVCFDVSIEWDIRDVKSFVLPLLDDEWVEVYVVGCDEYLGRLTVFMISNARLFTNEHVWCIYLLNLRKPWPVLPACLAAADMSLARPNWYYNSETSCG